MASYLYFVGGIMAFPFIVLILLLRSLRQHAYRQRLNERVGWIGRELHQHSIIIHGASVGEIRTLNSFVESLLNDGEFPLITLTSFTPTGSSQVKQLFGKRVQHCYLPIDCWPCVSIFLQRLKPKALVLMETELWPCLIHQCFQRNIPILLVNGRISARSFPRYRKITTLIAPGLRKIHCILCQSHADEDRFINLGADKTKVSVSGNIKYDLNIPPSLLTEVMSLKQQLSERPVCVIGSSHDDEEALLLDAMTQLKQRNPSLLFILAPRHPERFADIKRAATETGFNMALRSEGNVPNADIELWLIDTMGELLLFYGIADVCIVAGSFGRTGGHNPLEPALFAKPIIIGPNMTNFAEITQTFLTAGAVLQIDGTAQSLADSVSAIFEGQHNDLGASAKRVVEENQGATQITVEALKDMLYGTSNI